MSSDRPADGQRTEPVPGDVAAVGSEVSGEVRSAYYRSGRKLRITS